MTEPVFISLEEGASRAGMTPRQFRKLILRHGGPSIEPNGGGSLREALIREDKFDRWLNARRAYRARLPLKTAGLAAALAVLPMVAHAQALPAGLGSYGSIAPGVLSSAGVPSLLCNSAGQNNTQSLATGNICVSAIAPTSGPDSNYAPIVANIYSANNAAQSSTIAPVGEYVHAVSGPSSVQTWAQNPIMDIFPGSTGGGIVDEEDLNNWDCDPGNIDNPSSTCRAAAIGTLYEGASPFPAQEAIDISGASTANAQWHEGIAMVGGDIIDYASIYQNDGATFGYVDKGAHAGNMIDLGGSASNAAVQITTNAPVGIELSGMAQNATTIIMLASQMITWSGNPGNNVSLTTNKTTGDLTAIAGSVTPFDLSQGGNLKILGGLTTGTAPSTLGATTVQGALVTTSNIVSQNGAAVIFQNSSGANDAFINDNSSTGMLSIGNSVSAAKAGISTYSAVISGTLTAANIVEPTASTPASSTSSCITGQRAWDANYEYRCVSTNSWRRAALSTF